MTDAQITALNALAQRIQELEAELNMGWVDTLKVAQSLPLLVLVGTEDYIQAVDQLRENPHLLKNPPNDDPSTN